MSAPHPWKDVPRPAAPPKGARGGTREQVAQWREERRKYMAWYDGLDLSHPVLDGEPAFEKLKAAKIAERQALDAKMRAEEEEHEKAQGAELKRLVS